MAADVVVVEKHMGTPEEAREKIASFQQMLDKYGVKPEWRGNHAKLKGLGVKGTIDVDAENVRVELSLGMMAKAAGVKADKLEGSIRKRLQKSFGTWEGE